MHKRALLLAILGVGILGGYSYVSMTQIDNEDEAAYLTLKRMSQTGEPIDTHTSQNKKDVRKELWTPLNASKPDVLLHTRLFSDTSRLILSRSLGKEEVMEEMQGVTLFTQEAFEGNFQWVRVMIAKDATYQFKQERLTATNVKIYRFKLPGKVLPESFPTEKPLMEGEASWMEFYLRAGKVDLNASNVTLRTIEDKASLASQSLIFDGRLASLEGDVVLEHPFGVATSESGEAIYEKGKDKGGLTEATLYKNVKFTRPDGSQLRCQKANFLEKTQKMFCDGPATLTKVDHIKDKSHSVVAPGGIEVNHQLRQSIFLRTDEEQIHFTDSFGEIYSDKATIEYDEKKVKSILMEGKVFMVHSLPSELERSYAYADRAEYFPETLEMVLDGDRVLVFDKINQVEVSAPRLRIKRNLETKKETIKGEGDVRFTLEEKEFQLLKNRFKLEEKDL